MNLQASARRARAAAAVGAMATLLLTAIPRTSAARTLTWIPNPESLVLGKAEGMALTTRGRLFLAPRISGLGGSQTPEGPVQVWAMVGDGNGNVYLGTGPEGQILKIDRAGEPRLHFTVDEPMVTALAIDPGGELLAGTAPGGTIYRIRTDGRGEAWTATEERYIWSLAVGAGGEIYAGTGERGRILEIGPTGRVEVFFDSQESHIVSLQTLPEGGLLAGGAGRGLVYRIDGEGHALVLHDDELPEVAALQKDSAGDVIAALVAPAEPVSRRPALRLRLPDGVEVGTTDEAVGTLEESSGPTLHGYIEGLPTEKEREAERPRGRVVRIGADGTITELWSSTREVPFCLAEDDRRRVLFGTGEPARLYRVELDGDVALLATLREAQLTGLLNAAQAVVLSTSNPAAAYTLGDEPGQVGTFVSRPFDAGGPARWGSIRWEVSSPGTDSGRATTSGSSGVVGRTEIYTRTGNSHEPDDTWSAWSPAMIDPEGSAVVNPDGRFLQWRVRQVGGPGPEARLEGLSVRYEPYNRRPRLDDFRVDRPGSAGAGALTFRWSASDPDEDPVEVRLEYRPLGAAGWATAGVTASSGGGGEWTWATGDVPEGRYEVRGVISDQPANPPGQGLEATLAPVLRVVVDRSPPEIEFVRLGDGVIQVLLADALSDVSGLALVEDGRTRSTPRPEDGVCDSRRESFRLGLDEEALEGLTLRGTDAAGNVVERALAADSESN